MALSMGPDYPVFQEFKSKDHRGLKSLPTHVSDKGGGRYVLWSDIQLAFKVIDSLKYKSGFRVLFMADEDSVSVAYYVVLDHEQGHQVEEPHHVQLTRQTPNIAAEQDGSEWGAAE
ncbi:hypothetical protein BG006_004539 [Podila minutissima]|uniref:Uncharacterized protein n=1 Tax=Podila minutissima TaxID=64525 RepID=A0A9P5VMA7_9FUNG|nr:hypothetical protein BG006_004539 [Podila minutissima]